MAQTLFSLFLEFLRGHADEQFTGSDVARRLVDEHAHLAAKGVLQVSAEISSNYTGVRKRNALPPQLRVTADRPRKFYWTDSDARDQETVGGPDDGQRGATAPDEHSLYPKLIEYLEYAFPNMSCRRIDETTSRKTQGKGANKWLHPDVVGRQLLSVDWGNEMRDLGKNMPGQKMRLWSLEVKTKLEKANVRESFFQSVANSSWANYAYLAAEVIDETAHVELQLLSPLHGVGLIRIDRNEPQDSQVMLAARERSDFDLAACNRLARENPDFADFMRVIADELITDRPIASSSGSGRRAKRSR